MRPEIVARPIDASSPEASRDSGVALQALNDSPTTPVHDLDWALLGDHGLRSGWSLLVFAILYRLFSLILGTTLVSIFPTLTHFEFSPLIALASESIPLLAALGALAFVAKIEHRRILDYNLSAPRSARRFLEGLVAGFGALSALVAAMAWGGWLHFGPVALTGAQVLSFAAQWGAAFLVVGLFEEGAFRGYLHSTLTRGIQLWGALGIVAVLCLDLLLRSSGLSIVSFLWSDTVPSARSNGFWGVYAFALLGVLPCLRLHLGKSTRSSFWQAAWVTSTLFGYIHTGNNGENWIGIFAASAIGFVFCVSIRLTGSAWWAIGCHAAWDWAETYFYGTADSGMIATGHFLTTRPTGNALWSGGTDGPEGSLLVLAAILLLLLTLLALYGREYWSTQKTPAFD